MIEKLNEEEIKLIRKNMPISIAEELCNIQPIELNKEDCKSLFTIPWVIVFKNE